MIRMIDDEERRRNDDETSGEESMKTNDWEDELNEIVRKIIFLGCFYLMGAKKKIGTQY